MRFKPFIGYFKVIDEVVNQFPSAILLMLAVKTLRRFITFFNWEVDWVQRGTHLSIWAWGRIDWYLLWRWFKCLETFRLGCFWRWRRCRFWILMFVLISFCLDISLLFLDANVFQVSTYHLVLLCAGDFRWDVHVDADLTITICV